MFRPNKIKPAKLHDSCPVLEDTVKTEVSLNGSVEVSDHILVKVDVTDPDLLRDKPTPEEYKLENRIKAGIGLDEVPTEVLTPNGVASINQIAESVLAQIEAKSNIINPE